MDQEAGIKLILRAVCSAQRTRLSRARPRLEVAREPAELVAKDLGATRVAYYWHAQRRGFVRNTLGAKKCDVIMGVPSSFEMALTTRPYYRSTYVFVTRADRPSKIRSFDDPALRGMRIGIQVVGDEGSMTPAGCACRSTWRPA